MQGKTIAIPVSRNALRGLARQVRVLADCEDSLYFDIVRFVEQDLYRWDSEYEFEVVERATMGDCHGRTYPDKHKIEIREDVYENAVAGKGRDRLTIAHEVGHYLLHESENLALARAECIPDYRDPEWQATAFGGELLVPAHLVQGMTVEEVAEKCGVSLPSARYQLAKQKKR